MFIRAKAVKEFMKANNKQISKDALFELECRVHNILRNAVKLTPSKHRVSGVEITFANS